MKARHRRYSPVFLLVALLCISSGGSAQAEAVFFATLDGPLAGTSSPATGTATLILNDAETQVEYFIQYSGLLGVEFAAHFHRGSPSQTGPVLNNLTVGSPKTGVWAVGPTEVGWLNSGNIYVNVHTDFFAAGEIRGNFEVQTVADEAVSWGSVKALFQ